MVVKPKKEQVLKTISWIMLSIIPAIIVTLFTIFSLGADAKTYVTKVEYAERKITELDPRVQKHEIDIHSINLQDYYTNIALEENKKEIRETKDDIIQIKALLHKMDKTLDRIEYTSIKNDNIIQTRIEKIEKFIELLPRRR